jgi:integrase
MTIRTPSYRLHKARNCAVVTITGKDHYLGQYGSPESWEKYHRLIAEWLASQKMPAVPPIESVDPPITINELVLRFWRFVQSYYVKNDKPTSEQTVIRQALRFVRKLYGSTAARNFSPKALKAVRQAMIEHKITTKVKVLNPTTGECEEQVKVLRHGLCRKVINKQIGRIRRMFAWAVEEELLPVAIHQALLRVKGLKKGKAKAREKPRIKSVLDDHVDAVLPLVPRMVRTMVEIQRLCGGRPQDILEMRAIDIDQTGSVWEYHPGRYKTEHHNDEDDPDKERVVFLGPKAQALLMPYLSGSPSDYVFNPRRSGDRPAQNEPPSPRAGPQPAPRVGGGSRPLPAERYR